MSTQMDINQILQHLPHRFPFLLIDRVLSLEPGKEIIALKNVSMNEPFFPGHYPGFPVMPGVLIVEAMAQAAALLSFTDNEGNKPDDSKVYLFVGIDGARFKRPVGPGDQLILNVKPLRFARGIGKFAAVATVNNLVVAEAELMCTMRDK